MEAVTYAASSAADTVNKAIFGESTNKEQSQPITAHTQRSGNSSSDSTALDSCHDNIGGGKFHPVDSDSSSAMRHDSSKSSAFEPVGRDNNCASGSKLAHMGASNSGISDTPIKSGSSTTGMPLSNKKTSDPILGDKETILDSSASFAQIQDIRPSVGPSLEAGKHPHDNSVNMGDGSRTSGLTGDHHRQSSLRGNGTDYFTDARSSNISSHSANQSVDSHSSTVSCDKNRDSSHLGDSSSVDAPNGPTRTEISANSPPDPGASAPPHKSATEYAAPSPNDSTAIGATTPTTPATHSSLSDSTGESTVPTVGPPAGAVLPSHNIPHNSQQFDRSGEQHSRLDSSASHRKKSIPLVEGHPESNSPKTLNGPKLPTVVGTGEGTGTQYIKSNGVEAEGGTFDASAAGAGVEADRLRGHKKDHSDAGSSSEQGGQHSVSDSGSHNHDGKPSLGHRLKEKLLHHK